MLFQFDYKKAMMTYLENKYPDDTFHFINIGTELWNANYVEMIVSSDKFPAPEYYIHVRMDEKSHEITENYIEFYYREQTNSYLKPIVDNVYGPCQVRNGISGVGLLPSSLSPDMEIVEYLQNVNNTTACVLGLSIHTTNDSAYKEEDIESLRQALASQNFRLRLTIYYVNELNEDLDIMNGIQIRHWMKAHCSLVGTFNMNEDCQFKFEDWREYI
ncbi:MAG: hypothetical protein FWG40_06770 [Peptococcaceae bacterium]|nr:hypothetical protein [Peptococcaceae bacterium]